jgi:hypothetical protein
MTPLFPVPRCAVSGQTTELSVLVSNVTVKGITANLSLYMTKIPWGTDPASLDGVTVCGRQLGPPAGERSDDKFPHFSLRGPSQRSAETSLRTSAQ